MIDAARGSQPRARPPSRLARGILISLAVIGGCSLTGAIILGVIAASAVRKGFSTRDAPSPLEAMAATAARRLSMRGAASMKSSLAPSAALIEAGRAHWADHCATCHANDGSGQTEMGQHLYPRAPDMRLPSTQSMSDGELFGIITNGVRLTGMPAWGDEHGDASETWALVRFIRHLPALTSEERKEMEKLNPRGPDETNEEDQFLEGTPSLPAH